MTQTVVLELPDQLYRHLEGRAAQTRRTVADELLLALIDALPEAAGLPDDLAATLAALDLLGDDDLWRAAQSQLTLEAAAELEDLHLKQQREGLTALEMQDQATLTQHYERAMVVRARSVALLKERGRDVSGLLHR